MSAGATRTPDGVVGGSNNGSNGAGTTSSRV